MLICHVYKITRTVNNILYLLFGISDQKEHVSLVNFSWKSESETEGKM